MTARDIMTRCVAAATRGVPGREVALQMLAGRYSGLPVVENDGTVVGVVSEFDLLMAVRENKDLGSVTAGELMTPVPYCVDEDATLEEIIEKLTLKHVIRLPVTRNGKLVGLIARGDVLAHVVEPHGFTAVVPLVSSAKPAEACPPSPRLRRTPAAHSSTASQPWLPA